MPNGGFGERGRGWLDGSSPWRCNDGGSVAPGMAACAKESDVDKMKWVDRRRRSKEKNRKDE